MSPHIVLENGKPVRVVGSFDYPRVDVLTDLSISANGKVVVMLARYQNPNHTNPRTSPTSFVAKLTI